MTEILLYCKCSECDGGVINKWSGKFKKAYRRTCKSCKGSGKTVMEFNIQRFKDKMIFDHETGRSNPIEREWYRLFLNKLPYRIIHSDGRKDVTESLNPLYLVFIEEQECPNFHGHPFDEFEKCDDKNCTDGKIEVVTFTVFGSREDYDMEIQKEYHDLGVKLGKELKESK